MGDVLDRAFVTDDGTVLVADDLGEPTHPQPGAMLANHPVGEAAGFVALVEHHESMPICGGLVDTGGGWGAVTHDR